MRLVCTACGGIFETVLADGMLYFHACPPLSPVELTAALKAGTVSLRKADADRLAAAQAADVKTPVDAGLPMRAELVLASLTVERPDKRDENVTGRVDSRGHAIIKAIGKGVKPAPPE